MWIYKSHLIMQGLNEFLMVHETIITNQQVILP